MNRIDRTFGALQAEGKKALVIFVSAGDPDLGVTERLLLGVAEAGADVIEIGVPFSDPMADGPTIQAASQRALAAGTTLAGILEMIGRLRSRIETPLVLFSYYNVLFQYGVEKLARDSAAAGVDGWLVVDVPAEEAEEVRPALGEHGLHWVTLLAPTTPVERVRELLTGATGFVYYITVTGVTGARSGLPQDLRSHLDEVKSLTDLPVVAGFGISSPDMARDVARHADGVVVGSALIQIVAEAGEKGVDGALAEAVGFVRGLADALH